jgi:hypothetical protein
MTYIKEQLHIASLLQIDKAARETLNVLKLAIQEAAMSKNQVSDWFYSFKNRVISVRDDECSGLSKKTFKITNTGAKCGPAFLHTQCAISMQKCTV